MHFMIDCDDVLLSWQDGFREYLRDLHGICADPLGPASWDMSRWLGVSEKRCLDLISEFNGSPKFGNLTAVPGAYAAIRWLKDRGNRLTVISSCSDDPEIVARRTNNLRRVFGDAIDRVICVGLGQSKRTWLDVLRPGIWIEDNYQNALQGFAAGNKTFIMRRNHNRHLESASNPHLIWCDDWQELISHFS